MFLEWFLFTNQLYTDAAAALGGAVKDREDEDVHHAAPQWLQPPHVNENHLHTRSEEPAEERV